MGWKGIYYDSQNWTNQFAERDEGAVLNIRTGLATNPYFEDPYFHAPPRGVNGISAIYRGLIRPRFSENYRFFGHFDNEGEVWLNGHSISPPTGILDLSVPLSTGRVYEVEVRYRNLPHYSNSNPAAVILEWQSPSQPRELVPHAQRSGRAISEDLQAHFAAPCQTPAYLWLIEPKAADGVSLRVPEGYTSYDRDILYNPNPAKFAQPIVFRSIGGFSPSEVPASVALGSDAADLFLMLPAMTRARVLSRYYENAIGTVMVVNYEDLSQGHVVLMAGRLRTAEIEMPRGITFRLSSWSDVLSQPIGRLCGPICPWRFLYGHCRNNVDGFGEVDAAAPDDGPKPSDTGRTRSGVLSELIDASHLKVTGITAPDGWANFGFLRLTEGEYAGAEFEIKEWNSDGSITLALPLPLLPPTGLSADIEEGCEHTVTACEAKGNTVNFGGMPYLPSEEVLVRSDKKEKE